MATRIEVTLTRSPIGSSETQKRTLTALGLRKLNQTVQFDDSPGIRGQIAKISHLVTWSEVGN